METAFDQVQEILRRQGSTLDQVELFRDLYQRFMDGEKLPDWKEIHTPAKDSIVEYAKLEVPESERAKEVLSQLAICRLNGGLGTSMGCIGPKSAIEVRDGMTFLDLIVNQIQAKNHQYNVDIPLILMNSFNTELDTQKILRRYQNKLDIRTFQQNHFTRLRKDSLLPLSKNLYGEEIYYPPGHGDFFASFSSSGMLAKLLAEGKKYLFLANADNLGASIDLSILDYLESSQVPFLMEVTQKTRADVKGGTLVRTKQQELRLLEIAQVPKAHVEDFKSIHKFKVFNTNNLWLNLEALQKRLNQGPMHLEVIVNHKKVQGLPVIQLETAMGSAIKEFEGSKAILVPRSRFLPVKKTDDLLLVQSNLFLVEDGVLVRNQERSEESLPVVRLGDHFKKYEDYQARFQEIPDILFLDLLTVVGDVNFGRGITLKGNVIVVCERGRLQLPDGSHLENRVLTGNIEIAEL